MVSAEQCQMRIDKYLRKLQHNEMTDRIRRGYLKEIGRLTRKRDFLLEKERNQMRIF